MPLLQEDPSLQSLRRHLSEYYHLRLLPHLLLPLLRQKREQEMKLGNQSIHGYKSDRPKGLHHDKNLVIHSLGIRHENESLLRVNKMSNPIGLTDEEVKARRARYGSNEIQETPSHPILGILRETIRDPMILFMFIIAALYGWTKQVS